MKYRYLTNIYRDLLKLEFVGTDGSMGLRKGRTYNIRLFVDNGYIWAEWVDTYGNVRQCPYSSLSSFCANWRDVTSKR